MFGEVVRQEGLQISDLLLGKVQFHQGDMLLDILELIIYPRKREIFANSTSLPPQTSSR